MPYVLVILYIVLITVIYNYKSVPDERQTLRQVEAFLDTIVMTA
jgi:uncharacterized membrane protein SirB2